MDSKSDQMDSKSNLRIEKARETVLHQRSTKGEKKALGTVLYLALQLGLKTVEYSKVN